MVVPSSFPARRYDSDTTDRQTIWVDPIPGVSTPGYVLVPYLNYFKDEEDNRFFTPHTSIVAPMSYILAGGSDVNTVWYGLLLNYDANHGTGENHVAEQAVPENGQMVVDTNMFTYPLHKFLGWNTEPDGSGTHYDPADTIALTDHSQILYAEWCDTKTDTLIVASCTQYEWNGVVYTESGVYDQYFEDAGGCDSISTLVLTLAATPLQVEITPDSHSACSNTETILSAVANSTSDELSYVWNTAATSESITVAPTTTTSYSVIVTDEFGCEAKDTVEITVTPSYNQNESLTICQSELPYDWRDTTFKAETVTGDYVFNRQMVNGCDSIVTLHLTVKPAALDMDNLTDYIRCNGGAFSVIPTGNIPEGTLYIWTVEDNANVTGQSTQTTPVAAPISQMLTNNSAVKQTVVYHVTPITGDCEGDVFTITVDVEPTPELTMTCPEDITRTLEFGSCALLIAPADLGTPTWAHSLGWSLINISNNLQEGELYPEGDNVITWTITDECGNTTTCDQHVHVIFPQCPNAVDYEGNEYIGVRIDCDCWTQRNLESHKYSDGSDIPGIYSYLSDMYPDSAANAGTFGLLYDWESAIRDGQDNGHGHVQGICPEGWYLPTAEKYDALNAHGADALKSPLYWLDGGGSNTTGFTSLPAGYYDGSIGRYINLMGEAYYWSTTNVGGSVQSGAFVIKHLCEEVSETNIREGLGYSVRCIKEKE